jgi:phosphatidylglycerophosphatase A
MNRPVALMCATAFGAGYAPVAPGTFGSAVGLLIWWLLPPAPVAQGAAIVALFAIGAWSSRVAEECCGRVDPGHVVIDEVMGMLITLFMIPVGWIGAAAGFVVFRALDVVKPYPADRLERLHGGLGVMADDAMAGLFSNLTLRGLIWLSGYLFI